MESHRLGETLDAAFAQDPIRLPEAEHAFILGVLAANGGETQRSVRYLSRLDSLTYSVGILDSGWGLRSLSYRIRAEQLESMGMVEQARTQAGRFREAWGERAMDPAGHSDQPNQGR